MKSKVFVILAFVFFAVSFAYSQNQTVEKINKYCKDLDEKISEEGEYRNYVMIHTIEYESNVRAIGMQITTVKYYYTQPVDSVKEENGIAEFIDIYKPPIKITVGYNIAAAQQISIEYYPDENGQLMYYRYFVQGLRNGSEKFYFENKKLVLIKYESLAVEYDELKDFKNYEIEKNFSKEYLKKGEVILNKYEEHRNFFDKMIKIEKLDK